MPTSVEIPDVGQVEFPDDMDTASIEDAIRTKILPQAGIPAEQAAPQPDKSTPGIDLTDGQLWDYQQGAAVPDYEGIAAQRNAVLKQQADELLKPYGFTAEGGSIVAGPQAAQMPTEVVERTRGILGQWVNPAAPPPEKQPEPNPSLPGAMLGSMTGGLANAASGVTSLFSREAGDELAQFAAAANAQAQGGGAFGAIGRGVGSVAAFAPTMALGGIPGILAATTQMVAQAKAETRNAVVEKLRGEGWTDDDAVQQQADEAAYNAAFFTAATMPIYMGVGRGVAALTGKLLPNLAPMGKVAAQTATATGANVGTGALIRALEGQEAAPTLEQFTADALWGVVHGVGVRASEQARAKAEAELVSRGFAMEEVRNPDPQVFAQNMAKYGLTAPEGAPVVREGEAIPNGRFGLARTPETAARTAESPTVEVAPETAATAAEVAAEAPAAEVPPPAAEATVELSNPYSTVDGKDRPAVGIGIYNKGQIIGSATFTSLGYKEVQASDVGIKPEFQRKGAYRKIVDALLDDGFTVVSGTQQTQAAKSWWAKQPDAKPYVAANGFKGMAITPEARKVLRTQNEPTSATPPEPTAEVAPEPTRNLGPGAANIEEPFSTAKVIGAYNAKVDEQRAARGLPPLMSEARKGNEVSWGNAVARIEADPEMPRRLTDEILSEQKKSVTDEEQSALLWRMVDLGNKRNMEADRIAAADTPEAERMEAESRFADYEQQLQQTEEADRKIGTQSGRALQIRKMLANDDYTPEVMQARARKDKGAPLTPEEVKKVAEISQKITQPEKAADARKTEVEQADRDAALDERIKALEVEASKDPAFTPEVKSIADRVIDFFRQRGDAALKRFRSKFGQLNAGVDPTMLVDLIEIGSMRFGEGFVRFSKWGAQMVHDIGKGVEPYLKEIWAGVQKDADDTVARMAPAKVREKVKASVKKTGVAEDADAIAAKMKEKLADGKNKRGLLGLRGMVNKLAKHFVRNGIRGRDALVDAVHGVMEGVQKDITRRQTADLISGYGDFRPLSKNEVDAKVRDIKGELQLVSKLDDVQNRIPLAKSGPERAKPTDEARRIQQQLNEAKKRIGVVVTDPETQLKSTTDAQETRLRNRLSDVVNEFETGKGVGERAPVPDTEKAQKYRVLVGRINSVLESIKLKPGITEEQRAAAAEKSLVSDIEDLRRRVATGDVGTTLPKGVKRWQHLDALRAEKEALQAQLDEIRASTAWYQEEKQFDALSRQAADLEGRLSRGELTKERAAQMGPDTEMVAAARQRVTAAKDALATAREASPEVREKRIAAAAAELQRSIAEYDRRIRTEEFTTRTRKETPAALEGLKAERDAMRKFYNELRNAAKPRMSPEEVSNRNFKSRKLREIAEYKRRIAEGEFAPKVRKPFDVSKDPEFQRLAAEAEAAKADFSKLRAKWQREQEWKNKTDTEKVLHGIFETWNAAKNLALTADLSGTIQAGFAMLSHPIKGAAAIGKGFEVLLNSIFTKQSLAAKRLQAQLENSPNAKNGLYKKMGLDLRMGENRDENASSILERMADLETRWAGIPDVVKGLMNLKGKQVGSGFIQLAKFVPKSVGRVIRGSNEAFQAIVNTMRAVTADAILKTNFKDSTVAPTDAQLKLIGNAANAFTGSGSVKNSRALTALLHAPNFYWGMLKNVTGEPIIRSMVKHEWRMAYAITKEYVRALSSVAVLLGARQLFFGDDEKNRIDNIKPKDFLNPGMGQITLPSGITVDLTQGRGKWLSLVTQLATGKSIKDGKVVPKRQDQILIDFIRGRLSPDLRTSAMLLSMKDYHGNDLSAAGVAEILLTPITWKNVKTIIEKEGYTVGSFIQLLNFVFGNVNLPRN